MIAIHVFISGLVQGVGFRYSIKHKATMLDLTGWAKNTDDGKVEVFCQGDKKGIDKMLAFCKEGPPLARVDDVVIEESDTRDHLAGFEIRVS